MNLFYKQEEAIVVTVILIVYTGFFLFKAAQLRRTGSYLFKVTHEELSFRKPHANQQLGLVASFGAIVGVSFSICRSFIYGHGAVESICMAYLPLFALLFWATGPESLTVNLRTGWYVRREPWVHVVKAGLTTDLAGVRVAYGLQHNFRGSPTPIFTCLLDWDEKTRMLLGRFESREEAVALAKTVANATKIPYLESYLVPLN